MWEFSFATSGTGKPCITFRPVETCITIVSGFHPPLFFFSLPVVFECSFLPFIATHLTAPAGFPLFRFLVNLIGGPVRPDSRPTVLTLSISLLHLSPTPLSVQTLSLTTLFWLPRDPISGKGLSLVLHHHRFRDNVPKKNTPPLPFCL